jgi:hypothetical protein
MGIRRIVVGVITSAMAVGALAAGAAGGPSTVVHDMMNQNADKGAVVDSGTTSKSGSSVVHDM